MMTPTALKMEQWSK